MQIITPPSSTTRPPSRADQDRRAQAVRRLAGLVVVALALSMVGAAAASEDEAMTPEDEAPGWEAIDAALAKVYGDEEPAHFAPDVPPMLGGRYPFHGVSLYPVDHTTPHWHVVTYGLTELFGKDSPNPERSGFGFELTLRIPRVEGENGLALANRLLVPLGQYVRQTGNTFAHGHRIPMNFQSEMPGTELGGLAFRLDPDLGSIETPHGQVEFIQVVTITRDELERVREASPGADSSDCLFRVLAKQDPRLVVDVERRSVLATERSRQDLESCLKALTDP